MNVIAKPRVAPEKPDTLPGLTWQYFEGAYLRERIMILPDKKYYFIDEAADKLGCSVRDVLQYAADGIIKVGVFFDNVCCHVSLFGPFEIDENANVYGIVYLSNSNVERFLHSVNFDNILNQPLEITSYVYPDEETELTSTAIERISFCTKAKGLNTNISMKVNSNLYFDSSKIIVVGFPSCSEKTMSVEFSNLPKELSVAVDVFKEFWQDRPQELNPAKQASIDQFIKEKMGGEVSAAALDRIRVIARPEISKMGGAPKVGAKSYKGRSKENPSA